MSKGVGFRPKLLPPQGRQLQRSYRPCMTCFIVCVCIAVLILVVFGLTAYNIYSHRFGLNEHKFHSGDQVSLLDASSDLSAVFCASYLVKPAETTTFYLLPEKAELDRSQRVNFSFTARSQPTRDRFLVHTYYLPEESVADLSACRDVTSHLDRPAADVPAEFLVIQGNSNYNEWKKFYNNRHVKHRVTIPRNATCRNATEPSPRYHLTVREASSYYFVLIMRHHAPIYRLTAGDIVFTGNVSKSRYNVSGAQSVCRANQTSCVFALEWGSRRDVLAQVEGSPGDEDADRSFFTDCRERWALWVPVFCVLPVCLVAGVSLWCWYLLVKRRDLSSRYRHQEAVGTAAASGEGRYGSMCEDTTPLMGGSPTHGGLAPAAEAQDGCASIQD